ncbi:MAG: hypothetical protein V1827_03225 [Candidatus Micrarchaeota archaeon]
MAIFYERVETEEKTTIRFRFFVLRFIIHLLAIGGIIAMGLFNDVCCSTMVAIPGIAMVVVYHFGTREAFSEISAAKKDGKVKVSGSRFFPWDPMIFEITKAK